MTYILTALYHEAKPYIEMLQLKREIAVGNIQLFRNNDYMLSIGGAGSVAATVATVYLLTRYPPGSHDLFVNVGTAGSKNFHIGEVVLCHKIVNTFTRKEFYPEMLYKHPFREGILGSVGNPASDSVYDLADMEGAFVFEAAQTFFKTTQVYCIKTVSDHLCSESVTGKSIEKLMSGSVEIVCRWLGSIAEQSKPYELLSDEEKCLLESLNENLKLTFAMRQILLQECRKAKLRQVDLVEILMQTQEVKPKGKDESKVALTKLIKSLNTVGQNDI